MTLINRFDPFRELSQLQSTLNRAFQEYGRGSDELTTTGSFVPAVDIYEDEHSIVLKLEVPGVSQEDLDIRMENQTLTIRGERKFQSEEKEENFHRIERRYGQFSRAFTLPPTVDGEKITADYKDGVLQVKLAKRAEAKPKQIKVNISAPSTHGSAQSGQVSGHAEKKEIKGTGQAA